MQLSLQKFVKFKSSFDKFMNSYLVFFLIVFLFTISKNIFFLIKNNIKLLIIFFYVIF